MTTPAFPGFASPIIVALDYAERSRAMAFADQVSPADCRLKIGKEMFTRFGPELVRDLQNKGFDVFLDLKFHDIPNTVAKAVAAAAELGVWMVNVHAVGGERMMTAAREALAPFGRQAPKLIAVTVLTSMADEDLIALGIPFSAEDYAGRLADLAQGCGLDGVVCSAREAPAFKRRFGPGFALVTPGIRPAGGDAADQRRVMTPEAALRAGVDYMVIGRPITQAARPDQALYGILRALPYGGGAHGQ
ncbi:orotidine-5'-phosphate decarboxylase [Martelella alba]|uniref:Orotidine 5'-phosphate decarboxylase n=1 Tax=Martelella alba TaxID=2590451 RepID=A0ABY2SQV0_9HYPH|nr:orotidine-5'-phosphate decarboxylase [Martelella alba]TKI08111.1 orotidine-5'-phosphate decarboxylase [Martelella alba]